MGMETVSNGFHDSCLSLQVASKTVKTVFVLVRIVDTRLKPGMNEMTDFSSFENDSVFENAAVQFCIKEAGQRICRGFDNRLPSHVK